MTEPIYKVRKDGFYYWVFPLEGRDLFSADAFKTESEAVAHFTNVQRKMAGPWIKDLGAALADRSASELIIEKFRRLNREQRYRITKGAILFGLIILAQALYIVTLL